MGFTGPQRFDKAIQTLSGLLHGILIDGKLYAIEVAEISNWCSDQREFIDRSPFNEIVPKLKRIVEY